MNFGHLLLAGGSALLAAQSAYSAALMLYAWEDEQKSDQCRAPETFEVPWLRFTILLPARHEEAVIQDTIQRVVDLNYPRELVQVLVVIESGDTGTIAKVNEKLAQLDAQGITHVRLVTFSDPPINKPHGLNIGLKQATGDIVTIFDAEDEPHRDILHVVNTIVSREGVPVVQCGVQLMNYADRWFSSLNVLEYFFWFKSRLHFHASQGMVPLGGNTVFITRDLLEGLGGWDQYCLTEDADIGIRLSLANQPIRVVYEDTYVTREETPPTVGQFIKQRTRWNQGFLQVLSKGDWRKMPTTNQRLLALYTLSFPLLQAAMTFYLPVSIWMMVAVKLPTLMAIIAFLPVYLVLLNLLISLVGLVEFTNAHGLKVRPSSLLTLTLAYFPYQWMLGCAAVRAVWRYVKGQNNWEKTAHIGAHRVGSAGSVGRSEPATTPLDPAEVAPAGPPLGAPAFSPYRFAEDSDLVNTLALGGTRHGRA